VRWRAARTWRHLHLDGRDGPGRRGVAKQHQHHHQEQQQGAADGQLLGRERRELADHGAARCDRPSEQLRLERSHVHACHGVLCCVAGCPILGLLLNGPSKCVRGWRGQRRWAQMHRTSTPLSLGHSGGLPTRSPSYTAITTPAPSTSAPP
jgi:hypothetical protein